MWIWILAIVILICYALWIEPRWFRFKRIKVCVKKKIPRTFTVLHLSDTHFAKDNAHKEAFFQTFGSLEPDFIFITGDIIDNDDGIKPASRIIGSLKAKIGKFAVLGNHDYWDYRLADNFRYHLKVSKHASNTNNFPRFAKELEAAGIQVLVNEWRSVILDGMPFIIAGTDDPLTRAIDNPKTLGGFKENTFNILLTHLLDSILQMPPADIDMIFSGHTHGGQMRIPWFGGLIRETRLPRRFSDGAQHIRNACAIISRGIGTGRWSTPRFLCRPEALWIEVVSACRV